MLQNVHFQWDQCHWLQVFNLSVILQKAEVCLVTRLDMNDMLYARLNTYGQLGNIRQKFSTAVFLQMFNKYLKLVGNSFTDLCSLSSLSPLDIHCRLLEFSAVLMYVLAIFILSSFWYQHNDTLQICFILSSFTLSSQNGLLFLLYSHYVSLTPFIFFFFCIHLCPRCSHVSVQLWGRFPFISFHPGAHPVLGCGAPSAPGPAAEPPTAPHSPASSGSQRPPSHLAESGPVAHRPRRGGPPWGPAGGPGESGWSLPVQRNRDRPIKVKSRQLGPHGGANPNPRSGC